ncbi:MAG: magnesium chelatase, partial [Candidatus Anoxymicrobium japonicum]
MNKNDTVFPFTAVVGQEQVKLALLLNAVSHQVGGVFIRGRRGTAKSTLARALAHLLPEINVVPDCPFSCDPQDIESLCGYCADRLALEGLLLTGKSRMKIVTLPLNATEEMVVGTLDIEKALCHGERSFDPGILARANRSILYVDEVNLLEDHIVDLLLDSAAMGVNIVEREGISFRHSARFILIGTMNPEEGDLRPQLEDRFGLCAEVDREVSVAERAEILKRTLQFNSNPLEFESRWHTEQQRLRERLVAARERYPSVEVPEPLIDAIALIVERAGADGHRADISMLHSARALAALEERNAIDMNDLSRVAPIALNHRIRKGPPGMKDNPHLDMPSLLEGLIAIEQMELPGFAAPGKSMEGSHADTRAEGKMQPAPAEAPASTGFGHIAIPDTRERQGTAPGKRNQAQNADSQGRYYRSASPSGSKQISPSNIAIDATIRASAARGGDDEGKLQVLPEDIKVKLRKRKYGACILFVVDASASMLVQGRLDASREAIMSLLAEAYQKRDRVGLVMFKDDAAQIVMSPTSSPALARKLLSELSAGGATPLSHGLAVGYKVLERELSRTPRPTPILVLISDGGGNVTMSASDPLAEAL